MKEAVVEVAAGDVEVAVRRVDEAAPVPSEESHDERRKLVAEYWALIDEAAERITSNWTSPLSAVEAVNEQRR